MPNFALVFILILTMGIGIYNNSVSMVESMPVTMEPLFIQSFNAQFISYCGTNVRGTTVKALISTVEASNLQNPEYPILINITSLEEINAKATYTVVESFDNKTGIITELTIYEN